MSSKRTILEVFKVDQINIITAETSLVRGRQVRVLVFDSKL
jgi:hypothetical protein